MEIDKLREINEHILQDLLKIENAISESIPMVASHVANGMTRIGNNQRQEWVKQQQTNLLELIYTAAYENEQFEVCSTIKAELDTRK